MSIKANVKDIVRNIGKNTKFLQPMYEAISNSLEAGATIINIKLYSEDSLFDNNISGFDIEDNGEGFNEKNIDAFNTLWTDNKRNIGCKGSGRFTWLKIFKSISIRSDLSENNERITIPFSLEYSGDVKKEKREVLISENLTIVSFKDVRADYSDKKESSNPQYIKEKIIDYLLIKLFLMKRDNIDFVINISNGIDESTTISHEDIPEIDKKSFTMHAALVDTIYNFDLYYVFTKDSKNSKKMYFCSNYRSTKEIDSDSLGFSSALPNNDSFVMFLCSDYFEGKDNDSRNEFEFLSNVKSPCLLAPLLIKDIVAEAKRQMKDIIYHLYPEILEINKKEVENAIVEAPYLAEYIIKDKEIIQSTKSLIISAKKQFENDKEIVKKEFTSLLSKKQIDTQEFNIAVNNISSIAAAELGEYIVYRDTIIKALEKAIIDHNTLESVVHNLVIPMRTTSVYDDENKHLLSNLWLIDDKFMTYSFVASDKTFKSISKNLVNDEYEGLGKLNRPDTAIVFSREEGQKDAIMLEYKGPNASLDEKSKSLTELPNNVNYLRESASDVGSVWSYILTTIDEKFEKTIINQDYKPLFASREDGVVYYKYLNHVNTHVYVMDYKALINAAFSRNETFLNILKKKNNV